MIYLYQKEKTKDWKAVLRNSNYGTLRLDKPVAEPGRQNPGNKKKEDLKK